MGGGCVRRIQKKKKKKKTAPPPPFPVLEEGVLWTEHGGERRRIGRTSGAAGWGVVLDFLPSTDEVCVCVCVGWGWDDRCFLFTDSAKEGGGEQGWARLSVLPFPWRALHISFSGQRPGEGSMYLHIYISTYLDMICMCSGPTRPPADRSRSGGGVGIGQM